MFWLDGLDIPLIQMLDASFVERLEEDEQPIGKPEGDSLARYGANLLPVDERGRPATSPIFSYPYDRTREALRQLEKAGSYDPCHGIKMRYTNPITGDHAMPTMGTFIQLLPKGFKTSRYRATDATVYAVAEGRGRTRVGEDVLDWGPQATSSWCRAGSLSRTRPRTASACCSPSPTARCRRRSACGARTAATRDCHPGACHRDPASPRAPQQAGQMDPGHKARDDIHRRRQGLALTVQCLAEAPPPQLTCCSSARRQKL